MPKWPADIVWNSVRRRAAALISMHGCAIAVNVSTGLLLL